MKKYFDKIILVLALVVLGGGVGIYFLSGGVQETAKTTEPAMTGGDYTRIPAPPSPPPIVEWEEAPAQPVKGDDMTWQYYVFTPPKIWWNTVRNKWEVQPPIPPQPFGLQLVEIKHTYYRLQLVGVVKAPSGDPKDARLTFSDADTPGTVRLKVGDANVAHDVRVLDFVLEPRESKNKLIMHHPVATILDMKTGETIKLEQGVPIMKPGLDFAVLKTDAPLPEQEWIVKEPGQTLEIEGNISYRVLSVNFDFDNPSVSVEKRYPFKSGPTPVMRTDYRILTIEAPVMEAPGAAPAPASEATPAPM